MTVLNVPNFIYYSGDGGTSVFPFPYKAYAEANIKVYAISGTTTALQTSGYSLSYSDIQSGCNVVFNTPPSSGTTIYIERTLDEEQTTDLPTGGAFLEKVVEGMADFCTMLIQQISRKVSRAVKMSVASGRADVELPDPAPNTIIGWDSTSQYLENKVPSTITVGEFAVIGDYSDSIETAIATIGATNKTVFINKAVTLTSGTTVTIPANIEFVPMLGGSINQAGVSLVINGPFRPGRYQVFTGTAKISGLARVYPEWWGGKGDSSTDNYAPFLLALNSLGGGNASSTANGGVIDFDKGNYNFDSEVAITDIANVRVEGKGATYMMGFKAPATALIYTQAAGTSFISFTGNYSRGWSFNDIALLYSDTGYAGCLLSSSASPGLRCRGVEFGSNTYGGSMADNFSAKYGVVLKEFESAIFEQCQWAKAKNHVRIADAAGSGSGPLTIDKSVFYAATSSFITQDEAGNFAFNLTNNVFDVSIDNALAQVSGYGLVLKTAGVNMIGNLFSGYTTRTPTVAFVHLYGGSGNVNGNTFRTDFGGIKAEGFKGDLSGNYFYCGLPLKIVADATVITGKGNYYAPSGSGTSIAVSIAEDYSTGYATVDLGPDYFLTGFSYSYYVGNTGASASWKEVSGRLLYNQSLDASTSGPSLANHVHIISTNQLELAKTAEYNILHRDMGSIITNRGAETGGVSFKLPYPTMGSEITFLKTDLGGVTIQTGSAAHYFAGVSVLSNIMAGTSPNGRYSHITFKGTMTDAGALIWRIVDQLGNWAHF